MRSRISLAATPKRRLGRASRPRRWQPSTLTPSRARADTFLTLSRRTALVITAMSRTRHRGPFATTPNTCEPPGTRRGGRQLTCRLLAAESCRYWRGSRICFRSRATSFRETLDRVLSSAIGVSVNVFPREHPPQRVLDLGCGACLTFASRL
jgi:hypothetical protein